MAEGLIVPCVSCGTLNRIPPDRLRDVPVCAGCREHLLDRSPHDVGSDLLQKLVDRSDLAVVVDFWAAWCGPCQMMAPEFENAARQLVGRALLVKLDTESEPRVAAHYGIQSIPTMIAFHRGQQLARQGGALQASQIVGWVERLL